VASPVASHFIHLLKHRAAAGFKDSLLLPGKTLFKKILPKSKSQLFLRSHKRMAGSSIG
jgi:hypothetical protein